MGSNEKNRDPFEKLNLEVWASTLQSIASQTRRRARTRPLGRGKALALLSNPFQSDNMDIMYSPTKATAIFWYIVPIHVYPQTQTFLWFFNVVGNVYQHPIATLNVWKLFPDEGCKQNRWKISLTYDVSQTPHAKTYGYLWCLPDTIWLVKVNQSVVFSGRNVQIWPSISYSTWSPHWQFNRQYLRRTHTVTCEWWHVLYVAFYN